MRRVSPWTIVAALAAGAVHAAPAGPEALPSLMAGVVGSGDRLSLQLRAEGDQASRLLAIGEVFSDGWVLTALTDTTATLSRDGVSRTVGLNPSGALAGAQSTAPPTLVRLSCLSIPPEVAAILSLSDAEVEERLPNLSAFPRPGLTEAESQKLSMMQARRSLLTRPLADAALRNVTEAKARGLEAVFAGPTEADFAALLGPDYVALVARTAATSYEAAMTRYNADRASQPAVVRVPFGRPMNSFGLKMEFYRLAQTDPGGAIYVITPPAPPRRPEQPAAPAGIPVLTAEMIAIMRTLPEADLPDTATLLASNQRLLANEAANVARNNPPGAAVFGPFGRKTEGATTNCGAG